MTLVSSAKLLCQWCGNERSSRRRWPKVGPPSNREQNAWSFRQKWSYCIPKIFLGTIQHHAGFCQNHYKQSDTWSEECYCNTRHYCMQFNTIYRVMHYSRVSLLQQKCHHDPWSWSLGDSANFKIGHAAHPHKVNENSCRQLGTSCHSVW